MEEKKLKQRGRYNEIGKKRKDVYHLSQKAKEHIGAMKQRGE